MRRWNGWGDESQSMSLTHSASQFLVQQLGPGNPFEDVSLTEMIAQVPPSTLPHHPLISTDKEQRVRHAKGQSLADWLAMRSGDVQHFPDGVCFVENSQDIRHILTYAKLHKVTLIPYGGGTSVAGHINPQTSTRPVLTVNLSHMNQLLHLDEASQIATFGAGTPGPMVEAQLRAKGYTLGHFPQSFELSTLGGWVASRSSGQQSLRYGRIEQMFAGGTLETFAGPLELPTFPASSAGPDMRELVLGSEGRFGILSQVKVRVTKLPPKEQFHVIFFPDWQAASSFCRHAVQNKIPLSMLRASNPQETRTQLMLASQQNALAWLEKYLHFRGCKQDKCLLTLGVTGSKQQVTSSLKQIRRLARTYQGIFTGQTLGKHWAKNRFRFPYLREALWQKGYVVDTLETATDWHNIKALMAKIEDSLKHTAQAAGQKIHVFTHISHVYAQGASLYTTYLFSNQASYQATLSLWQNLKTATSQTIVQNGGTISHQHGVGKDHAPFLATEKGPLAMQALHQLSQHFDPEKLLNPGTLLSQTVPLDEK